MALHSVYPHEPGRLPGCPACDFSCNCGPGVAEGTETVCVWLGHEENEKPSCTHQRMALRIERGVIPVHRDGYDMTWRTNEGQPGIVTVEWLVCRDCGQLTSIEADEIDLGDDFELVPHDG